MPSRFRGLCRLLFTLMLTFILTAPPLYAETTLASPLAPPASPPSIELSLVFYWYNPAGPKVKVSTIIQQVGTAPAAAQTLTLDKGGGGVWTPGAVKVSGATGSATVTVEEVNGQILVHLAAGFDRVVLSTEGTLATPLFQTLTSGTGRQTFRADDFAFRPAAAAAPMTTPLRYSTLVPDGYQAIRSDGHELAMGAWALAAESPTWTIINGGKVPKTPPPSPEAGPAIVLDGVVLPSLAPTKAGNRLLVPFRALVETLGGQVTWDGQTSRATATYYGRPTTVKPGSYLVRTGDRFELTLAASVLADGRLLVPAEVVAGLAGLRLEVDFPRQIVSFRRLSTNGEAPPATPPALSAPPAPAILPELSPGVIFLTIDDGPSHLTPRFLDVLAARSVPATFFVIGTSALHAQESLRRAARDGHEIGNHTYDHDYAHIYTGRSGDFLNSVLQAEAVIQGIIGKQPQVLRTPGGRQPTPEIRAALSDAGYRLVGWDCSAADTAIPAPDAWTIFDNVVSGVEGLTRLGQRQSIVLMHDSAGHERTLEALPLILDHLLAKGYRFTTFDPLRGPGVAEP